MACSSNGEEVQRAVAVQMMPLDTNDLEKCRGERALRPACPVRVPEARQEQGFAHRSLVSDDLGGRKHDYYTFSVEWGAPYQNRLNERDRPPRFLHIVVHAGDLAETAFGFGWPGETPPPQGQPAPRDLGSRKWGSRRGELVLAPRYPFGGLDGSHLIFRWRQPEGEFALSMHGWEPLEEAEAALRATVLSIP